MKKALITGITGQDGAYLSQFLLAKGYEVAGIVRRSSTSEVNTVRLEWLGIQNDVRLIDGDLLDLSGLIRVLRAFRPDEVYNLAAQSFVKTSWSQPVLTTQVTALGVCRYRCRRGSRSFASLGNPDSKRRCVTGAIDFGVEA